MLNIKEKLNKLSPQLLTDIEASYYSIYKINPNDVEFNILKSKITQLQKAIYILNPNFNNAEGNLFLDNNGEVVYSANFFSNLITHENLDFEYEVKPYWHKNPLEKLFTGGSAQLAY